MREYLFDDWRSVFHAVFGFIISLFGKSIPMISALLIIVYVVYEALEKERAVATVGDVVEFMIGFMIGSLWWC